MIKIFAAVLLALCLFSCKSRHHNESALKRSGAMHSGIVKSSSRETWLFTWTDDPSAASNPRRFLEQSLVGVDRQNAQVQGFIEGVQAGYGVYFASDPVMSHSFGNTLVVVKAVAGQDYAFSSDAVVPAHIIRSNAKGIYYMWGGGDPFVGDYAVVVRDKSLLDLNSAFSIGGKTPTGFAFKQPLNVTASTPWQEIIGRYWDVMSFLGTVHDRTHRNLLGDPLPVSKDKKVNDVGILLALFAEFVPPHPYVKQGYDKLFAEPNAAQKIPSCARQMQIALQTENENNYRNRISCSYGVFNNLEKVLSNQSPRPDVSVTEAAEILAATGIIKNPEKFTEWRTLSNELIRSIQSTRDRAQEAVRSLDVLQTHFKSWSLQNWLEQDP